MLQTTISEGFSSPDPANVTTDSTQTITFNKLKAITYSGLENPSEIVVCNIPAWLVLNL
jgi:hypothetical protein